MNFARPFNQTVHSLLSYYFLFGSRTCAILRVKYYINNNVLIAYHNTRYGLTNLMLSILNKVLKHFNNTVLQSNNTSQSFIFNSQILSQIVLSNNVPQTIFKNPLVANFLENFHILYMKVIHQTHPNSRQKDCLAANLQTALSQYAKNDLGLINLPRDASVIF